MPYGIFNVQTDVNACGCTQGCTDTGKRVFTENWLWEKNPLPHLGIEPASAAWRFEALPVSYIPTSKQAFLLKEQPVQLHIQIPFSSPNHHHFQDKYWLANYHEMPGKRPTSWNPTSLLRPQHQSAKNYFTFQYKLTFNWWPHLSFKTTYCWLSEKSSSYHVSSP